MNNDQSITEMVVQQFEAARAGATSPAAAGAALIDAVENCVRSVAPTATIERSVDLLPGHRVTPDLLIANRIGVWVAVRLTDSFKHADRDALLAQQGKLTTQNWLLTYVSNADEDHRSAAAAARFQQRCGSNLRIVSVRSPRQMEQFIASMTRLNR